MPRIGDDAAARINNALALGTSSADHAKIKRIVARAIVKALTLNVRETNVDKFNANTRIEALVGETWEPGVIMAETDTPDCYHVRLWDRAGTIIFHARHIRRRSQS